MRGQPRSGRVERFQSGDGHHWTADFARRRLAGTRRVATRVTKSVFALSAPLGDEALEYVWQRGPALPASTLNAVARALTSFCQFLKRSQRAGFSPEAFAMWLGDLRAQDFDETTRRQAATHVRIFVERWLVRRGLASDHEVLSVQRRFRRHFRGFQRRATERLRERAIHSEEYVRLVRAIRLELEESRRLLARPTSVQAAYSHHALPLLPFVLLAGVLLAVRSAEVNDLVAGDVRERDGELWLYVHARNKAPAHLWMPPSLREAWDVAREWMERYRPTAASGTDPLLAVRHPASGETVPFDTIWVSNALRHFYAKYFAKRGRDGAPVLYRERDGARVCFDLPFSEFRSAAITEMARRERNPLKLRIFARHKYVATTLKHYLKQAHLEWVEHVATAHAASVEFARLAMTSTIASSDVERAAADDAGAGLPGGHCDDALRGNVGCRRARDCRLCRHFRIHPHRREVFVADLARARAEVERAAAEGRKRDVEVHENLAALNQAVIDRIDEYLASLDAANWEDAA